MNDKINDGGPAFPNTHQEMSGYVLTEAVTGMSLRDYFAAKAMQGMYANDADSYDFEGVARAAYRTADAMLKEREK